MNYSRNLYFKTLVKNIIKSCSDFKDEMTSTWWQNGSLILRSALKQPNLQEQELLRYLESVKQVILSKIQQIYSRQEGGYWPVTSGDKIFIEYLNQTLRFIDEAIRHTPMKESQQNSFINKLKQLLLRAELQYTQKIKAVFFVQEMSVWPSLESVFEAFISDPECEADLVYVPFNHINKNRSKDEVSDYLEKGYPIVHCKNYNLSENSPDIAFYLKPYNSIPQEFYIDSVEKVVERSVYIPYGLSSFNYENSPQMRRYHYQLPLQKKVWKIFNAPNDSRENYYKYSKRKGNYLELIGHPRFDNYSKMSKLRKLIPDSWSEKLINKKVFLWNTHFINKDKAGNETGRSTFDLFGEKLLSYFREDKKSLLIWRPHPFFFKGLLNSHLYSSNQISELKSNIIKSDNIILDTLPDYRISLFTADALISDISSLLTEFLLVNKPLLVTNKSNDFSVIDDNLLTAFCQASTWEEIYSFIQNVKIGVDLKKKNRIESLNYLGFDKNKNVGELVKNICKNDLTAEVTKTLDYTTR